MTTLTVHMTADEQAALESALKISLFFLEFGCGGSTQVARSVSKGRIVSVETDEAWVQKVRECVPLQEGDSILHADIGPVKGYGHPKDLLQQAHLFPNYWNVFKILNDTPDLILIDGRFRVATCLRCAVRCPTARILFHDFTIRPEYNVVLNFMTIVNTTHALVELKLKDSFDKDALQQTITKYSIESA
jgi:hypothetical protein